MNLVRDIVYTIVALAIGLVVGYICHTQTLIETTITKIDTLKIKEPIIYKEEVVREVSVPIYVSTPSDTVVVVKHDTVYVKVEVERREYRTEQYRAIISGARIGDLRPSLDELEIYSKSEVTVMQPKIPLFRPIVSVGGGKSVFSIGGGVTIKQKFDLEAKYLRVDNKDHFMIEGGWRF
jgi:hypothetical protein